ncbi:hypothetical protein [Mesorhizobium sp. YC-39]|uniref:hypothetical protein n=1 Tax=unclassified Mesorhizobium TaxID=325217 RepID=UPI0039939C7E
MDKALRFKGLICDLDTNFGSATSVASRPDAGRLGGSCKRRWSRSTNAPPFCMDIAATTTAGSPIIERLLRIAPPVWCSDFYFHSRRQVTVPLTKGRNRIWIADASASLIASFARGITGDGAATLNPGQTRQTEGLIPKLKLVKPDDIAAESSISCRSA